MCGTGCLTPSLAALAAQVGYEHLANLIVARVNGERVRNLRHLVSLIDESTSRYLRFDLEPHSEMVSATPSILLKTHATHAGVGGC